DGQVEGDQGDDQFFDLFVLVEFFVLFQALAGLGFFLIELGLGEFLFLLFAIAVAIGMAVAVGIFGIDGMNQGFKLFKLVFLDERFVGFLIVEKILLAVENDAMGREAVVLRADF